MGKGYVLKYNLIEVSFTDNKFHNFAFQMCYSSVDCLHFVRNTVNSQFKPRV